jgi:hypothetical protein
MSKKINYVGDAWAGGFAREQRLLAFEPDSFARTGGALRGPGVGWLAYGSR